MMCRLNFIPLVLSIVSNGAIAASPDSEVNVVAVGRSMEWVVPVGTAVSVANGDVIRVDDLRTRIRIVGKKLGETELRAGPKRLTVHVMSEAEATLFRHLAEALEYRRGLELTVQGKVITVAGRLLRFEDWLALSQVANGSGARYNFRAALTPEQTLAAKNHFKAVLRDAHLPEIALEFKPSAEATVPKEPVDLRNRVARTLGAYGFNVSVSSAVLSLEPMVRVRLLIAEVRKSARRELGISWPSSIGARLLPTPALDTANGIEVSLNALETKGLGKVLASPTILCRSGKEANFLAGGEIPIKIVAHKAQNIIWKHYGITLKIRPKADFSGRMSIGLETEVSMLDDSHKVDGVPGLISNRIESHFDLSASRTIVLSGLVKKEWSDAGAGLPGLLNLPVIGALFGSHDYKENRSELIVFVTPEISLPDEEQI